MYIHIGNGEAVREKDIIGIFDLEIATTMRTTGDFLRVAAEEEFTVSITEPGEMPKSFILAEIDGRSTVYIAPVSAATLKKRITERSL